MLHLLQSFLLKLMQKLKKLSLALLTRIVSQKMQRYFTKWLFLSKLSKPSLIPKLLLFSSQNIQPPVASERIKRVPPQHPKRENNSKSPIESSNRLYKQAEEILKRKMQLQQSTIPIYSFTPNLISFTNRPAQPKATKTIPKSSELVAVVSARYPTPNLSRSQTPVL